MPLLDDLRAAAREQAAVLNADFVGTEHLFLAWLKLASGPIADSIATSGLTPESFVTLLGQGKSPKRSPALPGASGALSSHAERIIEWATERSQSIGRDEVNWDDLILGLVHEPRGAIARALTTYQLKPSRFKSLAVDRPPKGGREKPKAAPTTAAVSQPVRAPKAPGPERAERSERPVRPAVTPVAEPGLSASRPANSRRAGRDPEIDDIPESRPPERPRLTPPPKPAPSEADSSPLLTFRMIFLLAIPAAVYLQVQHGDPLWIFLTACLGVLPLAALMGEATEHLADRTGPTIGGLLNATFGNAAELIIALAALRAGYVELVKASIIGSILGNLLFILGWSLIVGGTRASLLRFNRTNAGMSAAMLSLAVAGLVFPALFHATHPQAELQVQLQFSEVVAGILIATYVLSLFFVLRTHKPLFGGNEATPSRRAQTASWGIARSIITLGLATVGVVGMSEILVQAIGPVTTSLGISQTFLGLIIIPVIGNAAEHATAIVVARRGNTDLALQIALGSSTQIALFVAPILVFVGAFMAVSGMNLVFSYFQILALFGAVFVASIITLDGESHWFEGVQLLALFAILGTAAWFI